MQQIRKGSWSIALVCVLLGFMIAVQFKTTSRRDASVSMQRVEDLAARLAETEKERDELKDEVVALKASGGDTAGDDTLRMRAGLTPLTGPGVIVRLDDSTVKAKTGENPNLYLIHDDDLLKVINELRAAGAEAISVNGQRLIGTSEIRCAGPTLSVNNVRSAPPFEVRAIGDVDSLEQALKMRGGVAETLKVWGIQLEIQQAADVYIPPYKGNLHYTYAQETEEQEAVK